MDTVSYDDSTSSLFDEEGGKPSPENFSEFLPWACQQLRFAFGVVITNTLRKQVKLHNETAGKSGSKLNRTTYRSGRSDSSEYDGGFKRNTIPYGANAADSFDSGGSDNVKICTISDHIGNIIQLKFGNNKTIPRVLYKLIALVLQYHKYLSGITINKGINNIGIYELNKMLAVSSITDVCLDDTAIADGNYDMLLDNTKCLRHLSLSRCKITDKMVKKIAEKIIYPFFASQTLSLLNLTSNLITDVGAKYFAEALRTNRQLVYLNLSGNLITDEGATAILDVLHEFVLTKEEITLFNDRKAFYWEEKMKLTNQIIEKLRTDDPDKKKGKEKVKPPIRTANVFQLKNKVIDRNPGSKNIDAMSKDNLDMFYDKASIIAERRMGEFVDPFCSEFVNVKDHLKYCNGNNRLAYLNLSYNHISYFSIKRLLDVLTYQKLMDRKPRGLVNVNIEGNCIPISCEELTEIDDILTSYVTLTTRRYSVGRRKSLVSKHTTPKVRD